MDWFTSVVSSCEAIPLDTLPLRPLLSLCKVLLAGYRLLYADGLICKVLSEDMSGNMRKLESALAAMEVAAVEDRKREQSSSASPHPQPSPTGSARSSTSLPGLGYDPAVGADFGDLSTYFPEASAEGIYGARWITRILRFVALLLQQLGSQPELSISLAGRSTYAQVIAPFHAPVMGFVVKCVLYWAPSRAWVLKRSLGGASNEAASEACLRAAAALGPLAQACHAHLEARGLNFPDLISAVPGGF
jgi:hypothetical protein